MFENHIALVTGGSRGIGAAICRDLAARGAYVYINYNQSEDAARTLLNTIRNTGGKAELVRASIADPDDVSRMFQTVRNAQGRLDFLVNNAAVIRDAFIGMMSLDDWHSVIETNLTGLFLCCRAAVKLMIARRSGRIVNLGSISGVSGRAGQCNYASTKAGVVAFTRSLALEVSTFNIYVNCVVPGCIETELFMKAPPEHRQAMIDQNPLKRMGHPEEVASVVRFLLSRDASYIQGQAIIVDGGLTYP